VKRALDIIIHLQARLRMDVGGRPAQALSEFYASIFAQILQASQSASRPRFEHAIACVRNVRDAWREVARDSGANAGSAGTMAMPTAARPDQAGSGSQSVTGVSWTA
jgi:flagellar protein FliS